MLISENGALARLHSSDNLINRMKTASSRKGAMNLFGVGGLENREQNKPRDVASPIVSTETILAERREVAIPITQINQSEAAEDARATKIDDILGNADSQIKLATVHDTALNVLQSAMDAMKLKLDDVSAAKLPSVISSVARTIEGIRRERVDASKNNNGKSVNIIFYTPTQKKVEDYAVIDV